MQEIERVLVVGAGAVGAAVASVIHRADPGAVAVLAEGERADRYRRDGFLVNGVRNDFPVVVPGGRERFDLIVFAVKAHHLSEAVAAARGFARPETIVLSLLNGITSEAAIDAALGGGREPSPLAMILGIDAVRVGNETRFSSGGKIHFGEPRNPAGAWSPRVRRIAAFFDRVGLGYEVPEDMLRSLWYKFMINVGINQASAVLRAPYRVFQRVPEAKAAMESGMREVVALSRAVGANLEDADVERWGATLAKLDGANMTSMLQDVLAKRKTEVEAFAGTVVELGRRHGVPTPANELWFDLLRTIEKTY